MKNDTLLIWQNSDFSQFYMSSFDFNTRSFLDRQVIKEIMLLLTKDDQDELGACYSLFRPELNYGLGTDKIIGMSYTQPLKLNLFYPYQAVEYDMLLQNNLRARIVLGNDIFLENSSRMRNFLLVAQQHDLRIPVNKLQPNMLYALRKKKLYPTDVVTSNILKYVIDNEMIIRHIIRD